MQSLPHATIPSSPHHCAADVLDAVPPVIWFIRCQLRQHGHGLSMPQIRILAKVDRAPAICLSTVAEQIAASLPTTSRIVNGLTRKHLLVRRPGSPDRRQIALEITPRGRAALNAAWSGAHAALLAQAQRLTPAQRTALAQAMNILRDTFGSAGLRDRFSPAKSPPRAVASNGARDPSPAPSSAPRRRAAALAR